MILRFLIPATLLVTLARPAAAAPPVAHFCGANATVNAAASVRIVTTDSGTGLVRDSGWHHLAPTRQHCVSRAGVEKAEVTIKTLHAVTWRTACHESFGPGGGHLSVRHKYLHFGEECGAHR